METWSQSWLAPRRLAVETELAPASSEAVKVELARPSAAGGVDGGGSPLGDRQWRHGVGAGSPLGDWRWSRSWLAPRRLAVETELAPASSEAVEVELARPSAAGGGDMDLQLARPSAAGGGAMRMGVELARPSAAGEGYQVLELARPSAAGSGAMGMGMKLARPSAADKGNQKLELARPSAAGSGDGAGGGLVYFIRFVCRECWLSCGIILLQLWLTSLCCGLWRLASRRFGLCG